MPDKYFYRTRAVAIAGSFTRPVQHAIGEIAATEIMDGAGGYKSLRSGPTRIQEVLSFDAAYTQVTASEGPDGHFNTLAIATVENLNILDILKVERITARLVGLHRAEDLKTLPEPWIIPLGSEIVNLRIAGQQYPVKHPAGFHLDLANPPTYEAWKAKPERAAHEGETVDIPRFGTVNLCRLAANAEPHPVAPQKTSPVHRLTMMSIRLGSPIGGDVAIAQVIQDGGPPPDEF